MTFARPMMLVVALIFLPQPAAIARDLMVDGKPCNAFCQDWLGLGGGTPPVVSPSAPIVLKREPSRWQARPSRVAVDPPAAPEGAPLAAEADVGPPQPGRLVAIRGIVMAETAAERVARAKERLRMERETTVKGLTGRPVPPLAPGPSP